jgi:hypothetical protein
VGVVAVVLAQELPLTVVRSECLASGPLVVQWLNQSRWSEGQQPPWSLDAGLALARTARAASPASALAPPSWYQVPGGGVITRHCTFSRLHAETAVSQSPGRKSHAPASVWLTAMPMLLLQSP